MSFRRAIILPLLASFIVLFGTVHAVQHELHLYETHHEVQDDALYEVHHDAHHEEHNDDNCLLADINGGEAKLAAIIVPAQRTKSQAHHLYAAPETSPTRTTYARGPPILL